MREGMILLPHGTNTFTAREQQPQPQLQGHDEHPRIGRKYARRAERANIQVKVKDYHLQLEKELLQFKYYKWWRP